MVYLFTFSTICVRSKFGYGKPLYINLLVFSDPAIVEQPLGKEPFREPVSSIAVGCQLDPADPFLSVVSLSPVVLIMDLSYLTVGHFECNGLRYGHGLSDLFLPIALRMDFCQWSGSYFECNLLPHGSGLIDLLTPVAIRMDIYINGVLVILSTTDIILDKVYLLSFYLLHSEWTYPIRVVVFLSAMGFPMVIVCLISGYLLHSNGLIRVMVFLSATHWALDICRLSSAFVAELLVSLIQQAWIFQTDRIPSTHWDLDICGLSSAFVAELPVSLKQQAWIFQTDRIPSTHWDLDICRLSSAYVAELLVSLIQ